MVRCSRFANVLAVAVAVGFAHQGSAQIADPWSADASIGGGVGKGGAYFNNDRIAAHLGIDERVVRQGKLGVYVGAGYDWLDLEVGGDAICVISSRGGCRPRYPEIRGPSVSMGVVVAPWTRFESRVGVGGAAYSVDDTRVGAAVGRLEAGLFPVAHLGVILGTGVVVIPRYRHDRLTMVPVLLGLRVR